MILGLFKSKASAAPSAAQAAKQENSDRLPPQLAAVLPEGLHTVAGFVQQIDLYKIQAPSIVSLVIKYCRDYPTPANTEATRKNLTAVIKLLAPHVGSAEFSELVRWRQLDLAYILAFANPSFTITQDEYKAIGKAPDMGDRAALSRLMVPRISG